MLSPARIALFACAATVMTLPEASLAQIELGAKAGVSISNFLGDSDPEFERKVNFTGGFTFRHDRSRNIAIQPELLYAAKGAKTQTQLNDVLTDLNFAVIYLEVPVLLRYSFSPRSDLSPVLLAGPVGSWNIDARVAFSAAGSDLEFSESDDSIKALDFGVAVGAGVDFKWDLKTVTVEARYTYGVSNLIDNPDDPKHNGVASLTAGVVL